MLEEVLAILYKIVHLLTSNPAYLVIEAINPEGAISYAMKNHSPTYHYPAIMILDAGRGISYAMQNRSPTRGYWFMIQQL